MNPSFIGIVTFGCTFGGALLGMWSRRVLPHDHFDADSKDTIKVGIGLIATMTALVLGLVTASAKSSFDTVQAGVQEMAIEVLALDRALARYGPETGEIRANLKAALAERVDVVWSRAGAAADANDPLASGTGARMEGLADSLRRLTPRDDLQRALQARAIDLSETLLQARWLAFIGVEASVPVPFLVMLLFWLSITFLSFGLFAPRNATVLAVLLVCAVSVASAVFLVLEMDAPFEGLLRASPDALRYSLGHLNR
jgi:hypothetical protein